MAVITNHMIAMSAQRRRRSVLGLHGGVSLRDIGVLIPVMANGDIIVGPSIQDGSSPARFPPSSSRLCFDMVGRVLGSAENGVHPALPRDESAADSMSQPPPLGIIAVEWRRGATVHPVRA